MRLDDFRAMIERLVGEIPAAYRAGIVAVEVSPKTVPHPLRGGVYTLGECVPLEWSGNGADLQSRIVLYQGSFAALAAEQGGGGFDWREEAWETLSHEFRHHLEWRANVAALEAYDRAAEQNFARHEGEPFDAGFYRDGERVAEGVYKVDDDVFIELDPRQARGAAADIVWHGRRYRVPLPTGRRSTSLLILDGLADPPPGDAVLVVRRKPSLRDLWRRSTPVQKQSVQVELLDG